MRTMGDLEAALELELSEEEEYESECNLSSGTSDDKHQDIEPSLEVSFPVNEVCVSPPERSLTSPQSERNSDRKDSESRMSNKSSAGSSLRADAEPFVPRWQQAEVEQDLTKVVESPETNAGQDRSGTSEAAVWQNINSPEQKSDSPKSFRESLEVTTADIVTVDDYSSGEQDLDQLADQIVPKSPDPVKRSVGVNCDITVMAVDKLKKMYLHLNAFKLEVNFLKKERDCLERIVSNLKPNKPSGSSAIYLKEIKSLEEENRKLIQQNSVLSEKLSAREATADQEGNSNDLEHAKKYCLLEFQLSECNEQIGEIHKCLSEAFADYVLVGDVFSTFNSRKDELNSVLKDIAKSFKSVTLESSLEINELSIKVSQIRQQIKVLRKKIFLTICDRVKEARGTGSNPATPSFKAIDGNKSGVTNLQVDISDMKIDRASNSTTAVEPKLGANFGESDLEDDSDEEEQVVQVTFSKPRPKVTQPLSKPPGLSMPSKAPLGLSVPPKSNVTAPVPSSSQKIASSAKIVATENPAVSGLSDDKSETSEALSQSFSSADSFTTAVSKYPNVDVPGPVGGNHLNASTPSSNSVSSNLNRMESSALHQPSKRSDGEASIQDGRGTTNSKGDSGTSSALKSSPSQNATTNLGSTLSSNPQGSTRAATSTKTASSGNPSSASNSNKSNKEKIVGRLRERYYWKNNEDITRLIMYTAKKLASKKINLTEMRPEEFIEEAKLCANELGF